jgi:hypothetical protein
MLNNRSAELQKFSENAAALLLDQCKLVSLFESIGYQVEPCRDGYRGLCPACRTSSCFIGVGGKYHKVFWKCFARDCPSTTGQSKLCRNLLGLVRGAMPDQSLAAAIETISTFLGFKGRSFDITNGKVAAPAQKGQ